MTKKLMSTGLFIGVLATVIACSAFFAYADGPDGSAVYGKKITISKASHYVLIDMGKKGNGAKKVTVKSSNKKVLKPDNSMTEYIKAPVFKIGKKGTATATIKIKTKSGTKTYKSKVKVVAYKSPVKSVVLGETNLADKFKSKTYFSSYSPASEEEKIVIKSANDWKVKTIMQMYFEDDGFQNTKIKNGGNIKWHGDDRIIITMKNEAKNQIEELVIDQEQEY